MNTSVAAVYSPPATYPIPQAVIAEAVQGFRWARAYGIDVPEVYQHTAAMLASGGSVDLTELARLNLLNQASQQPEPPTGWNPGEEGYPCQERVLASLAGGYHVYEWTEKIFSGIEAEATAKREAMLASIGFDAEKYEYFALSRPDAPDLITDLVRIDNSDPTHWKRLNPQEESWDPVEYAELRQHEAIVPDSTLVADLVAAMKQGESLLLQYGEPVAFLPPDLVASGVPDDVEEETVYAIVDEVDQTAVLAAVQVTPGPVVCIREGGSWVQDQEFQDWFLSSEPPVLVAVGAEIRNNVLAQIDEYQARQVTHALVEAAHLDDATAEDGKGVLPIADRLIKDLNEIKTMRQQAKDYEFDELRELNDHVLKLQGYDELARRQHREMMAEAQEASIASLYDAERERRIALRASLAEVPERRELIQLRAARDTLKLYGLLASLDAKIQAWEVLADAPFTAAGGWDRNRGNAETLRRYWLRGRGAAKIRWGTKGDWRRCYRKLFKYMGTRAKGYCQLRHKEATGLYTGDKLHRRGVNAVKASGEGQGSANPVAHTGVMVALYPPEALAKKLALPGGEPWEELHVTLAYLGDSSEYDESLHQTLVEMVRKWATHWDTLEGVYAGKGLFVGDDIPEGSVTYVSPDLPGLPAMRQSLVNCIEYDDLLQVRNNHGFTPHTSLAYGDRLDDVEIDEPIPVRFEQISVVWGSSRTDITLGDS